MRRISSQGYVPKRCYFCGEWPACLYKDSRMKHGPRVCEVCVENGLVIRQEDGVYVMNPALTAEPEESLQ